IFPGQPVTVTIDPAQLPLPVVAEVEITGVATEAKQDVGNASLASLDSHLPAPGQKLMVASVPVVLASDQASIPVAATVVGTVPVSGPLTDAQLRATPVPVSGTVATGGLTDAQLRATRVPVDGSGVTQPVSGTFYQAIQPVSAAALPLPSG